ncbi:MAG TPA: lasso peptide biosynthesis B2 protein [Bacillota bacterium]|nr:lasso peptide biosynthesis B2 protein [Bacillota bacterium]
MFNRIKKFYRLPRQEQILYLEAGFLTGVARLAILSVPFKRLAPILGRSGGESPYQMREAELKTARTVGQTVRVMSRHTPWQSKCLVQAATAQFMLRRRGISATMYLGMAKNEDGKLIAHAWLRCGELIVTGGTELKSYAIVGQFASSPPPLLAGATQG